MNSLSFSILHHSPPCYCSKGHNTLPPPSFPTCDPGRYLYFYKIFSPKCARDDFWNFRLSIAVSNLKFTLFYIKVSSYTPLKCRDFTRYNLADYLSTVERAVFFIYVAHACTDLCLLPRRLQCRLVLARVLPLDFSFARARLWKRGRETEDTEVRIYPFNSAGPPPYYPLPHPERRCVSIGSIIERCLAIIVIATDSSIIPIVITIIIIISFIIIILLLLSLILLLSLTLLLIICLALINIIY